MTTSDQEGAMAHNAVAHLAVPGETDEQPFLKKGGDWIFDVGRFGEIPKAFPLSPARLALTKKNSAIAQIDYANFAQRDLVWSAQERFDRISDHSS
jgi:hypothetical protein